jgi:thiol-disulfide isomerase/thioredoxin
MRLIITNRDRPLRPSRWGSRLARAAGAALVVALLQATALEPVRADGGLAPLLTGWMENFTPTAPGKPMPKASFARTDDSVGTLGDYAGHMVVLNFFATWCVPCRREMPSLDRLQAKLADQGVLVVTVSVDRGGLDVITPFFAKLGVGHLDEVLLDVSMRGMRSLHVLGLPTTIVYGVDGAELGRLAGPAEWDSPEALALLRYLMERSPQNEGT